MGNITAYITLIIAGVLMVNLLGKVNS